MKKVMCALMLSVLLAFPRPGIGQFGASVVFDPSVYAETVLLYTNQLKSLLNEAEMLRQQYNMLVNQARSLAALPLNLWNEIQRVWAVYTSALENARGIAYLLQQVTQQFEDIYRLGTQTADVIAQMQAMLTQSRDAGRFAFEATAIFERLCDQSLRLGQSMNASAGAVGETSAIQAQTQVLGVMAEQQASLQQMVAAQIRMESSWVTMQTTASEQAKRDSTRWMDGLGAHGFKPPGQTGGGLPRMSP
jgi:P-type conjugative transfer protein TrbJ